MWASAKLNGMPTFQVGKVRPEKACFKKSNINGILKTKFYEKFSLFTEIPGYRNAYFAYACHLICSLYMSLS